MAKSIYTYYKERLIEIGGNNKCLYLKSVARRASYDIGRILLGRDEKINQFSDFLRGATKLPFPLINKEEKAAILASIEMSKGTRSEKPARGAKAESAEADEDVRSIDTEVERIKELKRVLGNGRCAVGAKTALSGFDILNYAVIKNVTVCRSLAVLVNNNRACIDDVGHFAGIELVILINEMLNAFYRSLGFLCLNCSC